MGLWNLLSPCAAPKTSEQLDAVLERACYQRISAIFGSLMRSPTWSDRSN